MATATKVVQFWAEIYVRGEPFRVTFHFTETPGTKCRYCGTTAGVMTQNLVVDDARGPVAGVARKTELFETIVALAKERFLDNCSVCKRPNCSKRYCDYVRAGKPRRMDET